eukprot:352865-Chlamydomonas_euryale.AAC.14
MGSVVLAHSPVAWAKQCGAQLRSMGSAVHDSSVEWAQHCVAQLCVQTRWCPARTLARHEPPARRMPLEAQGLTQSR